MIKMFEDFVSPEELFFLKDECNNSFFNDVPKEGNNFYHRHNIELESLPKNFVQNLNLLIQDKMNLSFRLKSVWINKITTETNKNDIYHKDISKLTFVLYINDDFSGGEFEYIDEESEQPIRIVPKKNLMLLMSDKLVHRVMPVHTGVRYSLIGFFEYQEKKIKTLI